MPAASRLDRRSVLAGAAGLATGALGFPRPVPAAALGRDGRVAASERITLGCIGVGSQGKSNLKAFLGKPEVQVLAVCDVDRSRREEAAALVEERQGKGCAAYNDFREIIGRADIDAVSIALPDHWHAIPAVQAARAGKDIYAEKPLAYSIAEGRAIVDAVHRYGVVWQTGSWQRSDWRFRHACELVRAGRIGRIELVRVGLPPGGVGSNSLEPAPVPDGFDYDMWLGPAPWAPYCPGRCHWDFRWVSDYSGGQLTDWAGHHVDIAHWAMGTERSGPVEIEGRGVFPASGALYDTPVSYHLTCRYREGFTMIVADSNQQPHGHGVLFLGSQGRIHVDRGKLVTEPAELARERTAHEYRLRKSDDHFQDFLECVRTRAATVAPVEPAHSSIAVAHLGTIAMRLGRRLRWDPAAERILDDPDASRLLSRPYRAPWHL